MPPLPRHPKVSRSLPARQEAGLTPTSRHEEGDAESAIEHPLPQSRQAGPVEGEGAADEDVQHDTKALPTTRQHSQRQCGPTGRQQHRQLPHATHAGAYPDVQLGAFVLLPLKHLRGRVRGAPAPRGQRLSRLVEIPKSKV